MEKVEVVKTKIFKDEKGIPITINGTNRNILCDYVVMAIGSDADSEIVNSFNLDLDKRGKVDIDKVGNTSRLGIFAGGDVAGIKGTVAWAARSGRNAAYEIINYLDK